MMTQASTKMVQPKKMIKNWIKGALHNNSFWSKDKWNELKDRHDLLKENIS